MKAFIIFKNADFTEGKGPMLFHQAFTSRSAAIDYLNSRAFGVYGAIPPVGVTFAEWCTKTITHTRADGSTYETRADGGWSGYDLLEVDIHETADCVEVK